MNLIEKPVKKRMGKIKVDGINYDFIVRKSFKNKMWAFIELYDYITKKPVKNIMVPKELAIGALLNTGEYNVCLLMKEVKPASWFINKTFIFK